MFHGSSAAWSEHNESWSRSSYPPSTRGFRPVVACGCRRQGRHLFSTDAQGTEPDSSERPEPVGCPTGRAGRLSRQALLLCHRHMMPSESPGCFVVRVDAIHPGPTMMGAHEGPTFDVSAPAGRTCRLCHGETMPIFEYRCSACGHLEEVLQKHADAAPAECPRCHAAQTMAKELSLSAFHLKGGGWYKDLYSSSSSSSTADSSSAGTSGSSTDAPAASAPAPASAAPAPAPAAAPTSAPATPAKPTSSAA